MKKIFLTTTSVLLALAAAPAMSADHSVSTFLEFMDYNATLGSYRTDLSYRGVGVEMDGQYDSGVNFDLRFSTGNFDNISTNGTPEADAVSAESGSARLAYHLPGYGVGPAISYEYGNVLGGSDDVVLAGFSGAADLGADLAIEGHLMGEYNNLDNFFVAEVGATYSLSDTWKLHAVANHVEGQDMRMSGLELGTSMDFRDGISFRGDVVYQNGGVDFGAGNADVEGLGVKAGIVLKF